ncbi:MAG TPA: MBL fold metallo-hydrolase [Acidimicrobiia bacterium]
MAIVRILAPNPGPFTGPGTNTYAVISQDECLIVDPGPVIATHERAILSRVDGLEPRAVLVTHSHPDHAPLANPLASALGVEAIGHAAGPDFEPDRLARDGDRLRVGTTEVRVIHTPGHAPDHLCFVAGGVLFSGDHIMGGSTVVVEDMSAYLASLQRLRSEALTRILPGHGEEISDPQATIDEYVAHRLLRERQVLEAVREGAESVSAIVERVYADVDPVMHGLASYSVLAHLRKLDAEGKVRLTESPRLVVAPY